jgi:hypothetical protein
MAGLMRNAKQARQIGIRSAKTGGPRITPGPSPYRSGTSARNLARRVFALEFLGEG